MSKTIKSPLFGSPVPYETSSCRKTTLLCVESSPDGSSVIVPKVIEDEMDKLIDMSYNDVSLSSLVSKGIDPHSLDMIDSSKMGIDDGIDALALHLTQNTNQYVQ